MKKITSYQITFKNGGTMEFASLDVAAGYAENFGLSAPMPVTEYVLCK